MEAVNTVDMVGAPSGSKTGQTWSHVFISNTDMMMNKEKEGLNNNNKRAFMLEGAQTQILNSVDVGTGHHGKYQQMLEAKYVDCSYCVMCYRLFPRPDPGQITSTWMPFVRADVVRMMPHHHHDDSSSMPPGEIVLVCEHCASFIRKNQHCSRTGLKTSILPMQLAINYIMSGGLTKSPCRKMLAHCIESLLYRFPSNPIILSPPYCGGGIDDKLKLIEKHMECFGMDRDEHVANSVCLIRWVTEGSQHFLTNSEFARNIRRYAENNPDVIKWWKVQAPFGAACRHCLSFQTRDVHTLLDSVVPKKKSCTSYRCVLSQSSPHPSLQIDKDLQAIEEDMLVIDGLTVFCNLCECVSVISYEYDCLVKHASGQPIIYPFADVYYHRMVKLHADQKKKEISIMVAGQQKKK